MVKGDADCNNAVKKAYLNYFMSKPFSCSMCHILKRKIGLIIDFMV